MNGGHTWELSPRFDHGLGDLAAGEPEEDWQQQQEPVGGGAFCVHFGGLNHYGGGKTGGKVEK